MKKKEKLHISSKKHVGAFNQPLAFFLFICLVFSATVARLFWIQIIHLLKSNDPVSEFQGDGEPSAKKVRDKIDQLIPGLGYPVVSVDVSVEENYPDYESNDQDSLVSTLNRIDSELDQLRDYLSHGSKNIEDE